MSCMHVVELELESFNQSPPYVDTSLLTEVGVGVGVLLFNQNSKLMQLELPHCSVKGGKSNSCAFFSERFKL